MSADETSSDRLIYACFECRKVFRKEVRADWSSGKPVRKESPETCPDCGGPMHNMGRHFKAPRRKDVAQWREVERLFRAGLFFQYRGGRGLGRRPGREAVERFIEAARERSEGERLEQRYASRARGRSS